MRILRLKRLSQILAVIIILTFFWIGYSLVAKKENDSLKKQIQFSDKSKLKPVEDKPPSLALGDFRRNAIKDGKVLWELIGKQVNFFKEENQAEIKDPKLNSYQNPERPVKVVAEDALIKFIGKEIQAARLTKNVVLTSNDLVLKTSEGIFNQAENTFIAPGKINITTPQVNIDGANLHSDLATDLMEIFSEVKSILKNKEEKVKVNSDYLLFDKHTGRFQYLTNVVVQKTDYIINSDELVGHLSEDNELKDLHAKGNVIITQGNQMKSTSEFADFDMQKEIIILTGNPEVEKQDSIVNAEVIHYYIKTGRSQAEGDVQVSLKEEKSNQKQNLMPKKRRKQN